MKMILAFAALCSGTGLVVVAQVVDSAHGGHIPYAKEGALAAALGTILWAFKYLLTNYIPAQQRQYTATLDNIAARDEQHHSDHLERQTKLTEAIGELEKTCRDHQRNTCPEGGATP